MKAGIDRLAVVKLARIVRIIDLNSGYHAPTRLDVTA
jgi:hypothetical protein